MRALSIRQPWTELILRGHKTIEVRSKATHLRERVYIYAGRNRIEPDEEPRITDRFGIDVDALPRGVLVGTVEIVGCRPLETSDSTAACFEIDEASGFYAWLLKQPERAEHLQKPKNHPQPVSSIRSDRQHTDDIDTICLSELRKTLDDSLLVRHIFDQDGDLPG